MYSLVGLACLSLIWFIQAMEWWSVTNIIKRLNTFATHLMARCSFFSNHIMFYLRKQFMTYIKLGVSFDMLLTQQGSKPNFWSGGAYYKFLSRPAVYAALCAGKLPNLFAIITNTLSQICLHFSSPFCVLVLTYENLLNILVKMQNFSLFT